MSLNEILMRPVREVSSIYGRLAMMMFLQYFGLGAWVVTLARYLAASLETGGLALSPSDYGLIYATTSIAAIFAPLLVGPLADRYFNAEKLLSVLHFLMALLLAGAGLWCERHEHLADGTTRISPWPLFAIFLPYALCLQPTMTLTTVIALRNLERPAEQFARVRLIGTLGWIVSGFVVALLMNPLSSTPLFLASATSLVMGFVARLQPTTPPAGVGRSLKQVIGLPAITMFRDRAFVGFALAAMLTNMMNQFYVLYSAQYLAVIDPNREYGRPEIVLTLAQWLEIVCMFAAPWLVKRYGLKWIMLAGLIGWCLRAAVLHIGSVGLVIAIGIPLHGFSYAFFGMNSSLFVDREAPAELRAGAQSLVTFLSSGPAVLLGNYFAGMVGVYYLKNGHPDWANLWLVPTVGCAIACLIFSLFFREPRGFRPIVTPPPLTTDHP